jgi:hypothetical protein
MWLIQLKTATLSKCYYSPNGYYGHEGWSDVENAKIFSSLEESREKAEEMSMKTLILPTEKISIVTVQSVHSQLLKENNVSN